MNAIPLLSSQPWVERLGWTLVHFLWQGTAIGLLYAGARSTARRSRPNVRYLLACAALAVLMAAPLATWSALGAEAAVAVHAPSAATLPEASAAVHAAAYASPGTQANRVLPQSILPYVVAAWLAGTVVLWLRLIGGWVFAIRLRSTLVLPAPPEWQAALARLKARVAIPAPVRLLVSGLVDVPTVLGWLRPAILIPAGALTGLPREQLEALLVHELAHIRRGDYAVNLLQSVAEALLFYHPAVWWVSGHIRAERELCCDDVAVAVTGDALTYARALADLEASRPAGFQAALAASGGSLAHRIARLLGQSRPAPRGFAGSEAVAGTALLVALAAGLLGQSAERPKFEVASIKPSVERGFMSIRPLGGGRLTATAPLKLLIQAAYALQDYQITGGPGWIESDRYEIEAKAEGNPNQAQLMLMLQSLIEERFQLKTRRESKEVPAYALVLVKGAAKLPPPKEGSCFDAATGAPAPPPPTPGNPSVIPCGFVRTMMSAAGVKMQGGRVKMAELARVLSMTMGRPVVDKTGFTGEFDLDLTFTPDGAMAGLPRPLGAAPDPAGGAPPDDATRPTVFSALQEQLGVKLEGTRSAVEVMVIEKVERPSAN